MTIGGGEAADQMVRMMLSGGEVAVRLGGSALKNLLALTMALAKSNKTISGKVNMTRMLRETRDLRVFPMTPEQYRQFKKYAKKQKILFSAIKDKDDSVRLVDVVMPATELDRANLIFERIMYQGPVRQAPERKRRAPERDEREPERERSERSPEQNKQPPQQAQEAPQEERSEEDGPEPQRSQKSPTGRDFRPEWTTRRRELPNDPWEIPPKKDSRSERDSPGTKTRSSTRRTSNGETTRNDRPSILGRLEAYRIQLGGKERSVPTREKSKARPKQR